MQKLCIELLWHHCFKNYWETITSLPPPSLPLSISPSPSVRACSDKHQIFCPKWLQNRGLQETDLQMSHWVPLLSVDETGEEDGVSDEENWSVVADQIPVAILCVELHGKSTRIPSRISWARFSTCFRKKKNAITSVFQFLWLIPTLRKDKFMQILGLGNQTTEMYKQEMTTV